MSFKMNLGGNVSKSRSFAMFIYIRESYAEFETGGNSVGGKNGKIEGKCMKMMRLRGKKKTRTKFRFLVIFA